MASLLDTSQAPPPSDCVTVMERDGEMKYLLDSAARPSVNNYPEVTISQDLMRVSTQQESVKSAFMPTERTVWQRAFYAWYDQGFSALFEEIVTSTDEVPSVAATMAAGMLNVLRTMNTFSVSLFPHMSLSNEELVIKFAQVADWAHSPVRAFAWHPHTTKFATALQDDSVRVHVAGSSLVPLLKHKQQKCVAHLAWQPLSASVLAVACQNCILIWHVEPMSLAARPSTSSVQVLQQPGHTPVTQLAWDPTGKTLLSASPTDNAILAWNVPTETCTPLRRFGGGGVCLLTWSPDGSKVVSASPAPIFRVWETQKWNCEMWSQLPGRVTAACWSHDGQVLLFAMEKDPVLHSVRFRSAHDKRPRSHVRVADVVGDAPGSPGVLSGATAAVMVADLLATTVTPQDGKEEVRVGGYVLAMVWSPNSERLAVLFEGSTGEISPLIALFKTTVNPVVQVLPSGFVKGYSDEVPHHIAFQPSFKEGALLSVVWSSGRVGYVPMYFVSEDQIWDFELNETVNIYSEAETSLYTGLS